MVDIAIVIALAAGAFAGWRKGFIVPLVVQAGALLSLATLYAGPLQGAEDLLTILIGAHIEVLHHTPPPH